MCVGNRPDLTSTLLPLSAGGAWSPEDLQQPTGTQILSDSTGGLAAGQQPAMAGWGGGGFVRWTLGRWVVASQMVEKRCRKCRVQASLGI